MVGADFWCYGVEMLKYKNLHPHYRAWRTIKTTAKTDPHGMVQRWYDFWLFAQDIGEKPEGQVLWRVDSNQPYGPTNFKWIPKYVRLFQNFGNTRAQQIMAKYREDTKEQFANMDCPKAKAMFDLIKRKV